MTKEDFVDWKAQLATKEFFNVVQHRIDDAKEILSVNAGIDSTDDRMLVGMIKAFNEVLQVEYEDTNES